MGNSLSKTDSGFGPLLSGKGYFTHLFEDSIFTTAPAIIAILATLIQCYTIVGGPKLVRAGPLLLVKLLLGALLMGCSIAMLVHVNHVVIGNCKDILVLLSRWNGPVFSFYVLDCVTRFLLLISQEVSKRRLIRQETLKSDVGSEAASGFWTRSLFIWLNSTLLLGFRKTLSVEELPALAPEFRAKTLFEAFKPQWERVNKRSEYALIRACLLTQAVPFITITLPRLCLIGFTFAQPFLLLRTTSAVEEEELSEKTTSGLVGATALIYFGIAVTKGYSTHLAYQVTTCIRGMLTVAIYDKMLRLSHQVLAESAAVTLMSTDLSGLEALVPLFHDSWAAVVELGLGLTILARIAGPSCVLFLVPGIVTAGGSSLVMKKMVGARAAWNEKIQDRVAKTSNVIAQLKAIKMAGLSEPMLGFIERLRTVELETSMSERYLRIAVGALNAFNRAVAPVIVLAGALFWTGAGTGLRPGEIYTILAVVAIVSRPLATLLVAIPAITSAMASFPRIQKFLCQDEQVDNRSDADDSHTSIKAAGVTVDSELARHIFQGVNLQIMQGAVVMLTGPVGCGKTTLLKSLIGEVQLQSGSVQVAQSCPIGYSDQVAWLENITIKKNICHEDYNAVWYKEVLAACALETDLADLSAGDETVVGANSSNLSGGQKQRIALARAVYCQAPLLVLDDPLSAVDVTTSSIITERLFGENGLLRKRNATVLMTTNSGDLCSVADFVFTMDMEGNIGRLENLSRGTKSHADVHEDSKTQQEDGLDEKAGASSGTAAASSAARIAAADITNEIRKGDITLYAYYIGSIRRSLVVLSLGFIALSSISDRLPAIFIRVWLDIDPDNKLFFIGFAGLGVLKVVAASISLYLFYKNFVMGTATVLHRRLLDALMGTTLSYLVETDAGSILSRFSRDMSTVAQSIAIDFLNSFYNIVTIIMEVAIICSGARYTASMIPALLIVVYLVQHFYLRTSRQLRIRELETQEPLFTKFTETSTGIQHIRAFKWQGTFMHQMQELFDHTQIPYYNLFCVRRWLTLVLDLTVTAIATMVVGLAIGYPSLTDENAVGLSMLSIVTFSDSLAGLVNAWVELEICLGSIARIKAFCFGTPREQQEDGDSSANVADHWPTSGRVEFRNVSASYMNLDGTVHRVLSNVSFTVEDCQKVGLSGRTGSGKSSILAVLLRMIDYTGSILIDGRELRTIPRELLRSRFITLTQDGLQLQGSIRLNLDPYNSARDTPDDDNGSPRRLSEEALVQALTRVGLWDSVQQCGGLDTEIAAANFSQGQIQLLGIARALLRKSYQLSKIVLIDEATSSVDNDTDKAMQTVFGEAFASCTVFMISHRADGLDGMDRVIALQGGQVEEG